MAARASCAIHQPNLFPRLSTLAKLFVSDSWIVLDDVQFVRRDYQHRARLRPYNPSSCDMWLSLPVHLPHGRGTEIRHVTLASPAASRVQLQRKIAHSFGRAPCWPALQSELNEVLAALEYCDRLAPIAELSTTVLLRLLGWTGSVYRSSDFRVRNGRTERLVDLTSAIGADTYVCGTGGARYLDHGAFDRTGLLVEHFTVPHYNGNGPWQDAARISALHALMCLGPVALAGELQVLAARWRQDRRVAAA